MIEPISEFAEKCRRAHEVHPLVTVLETGISANTEGLEFHVGGAFTTASKEQITEFATHEWAVDQMTSQRVRSPSRTLDSVLSEADVKPEFEVLIVDVEGHEASVFAGFDLSAWRPQMMIVELADVHPQLTALRSEHATLYRQLVEQGYVVAFRDAINTMLVRSDIYESGVLAQAERR